MTYWVGYPFRIVVTVDGEAFSDVRPIFEQAKGRPMVFGDLIGMPLIHQHRVIARLRSCVPAGESVILLWDAHYSEQLTRYINASFSAMFIYAQSRLTGCVFYATLDEKQYSVFPLEIDSDNLDTVKDALILDEQLDVIEYSAKGWPEGVKIKAIWAPQGAMIVMHPRINHIGMMYRHTIQTQDNKTKISFDVL